MKDRRYSLNISSWAAKIVLFARRYPIPVFAVLGLVSGAICSYIINQHDAGQWIWLLTLIIGGIPVIWDTVKGMLLRHNFSSDIVAMLAIVAAMITNESLPGVVIVIMQTGGKALEDYAFRRASSSLDELMTRSPRIARRKKMAQLNGEYNKDKDHNLISSDQSLEEITVADIRIGDILVVRPGDLIPVDGIIISGQAQIDESALTGEPLPKNKDIGNEVFSGTIDAGGSVFEIQATKLSEESQYAKIVQLVRKAREEKAPIQRLADKYAVWFTPITLAVSMLGWIITQNPQTILSVLVVATPCSLIFATPVAIMSGINKCAKSGIIIKAAAAIEQIGKSEAVVFDKTGTITGGSPVVEQIIPLAKDLEQRVQYNNKNNNDNGIDWSNNYNIMLTSDNNKISDDLLLKAATIEQMSSHPAARVITQKAKEKFGSSLLANTPTNFHEIAGAGVEGNINGERVTVGSQSLFENNNYFNQLQPERFNRGMLLDTIKKLTKGKMVAFVGINGNPVGAIILGDKIRSGIHVMIKRLQKLGVKETVMLTGDSFDNAQVIAKQASITSFESNLLPEQKVFAIKKLKSRYKNVVMVGDGINDAPALTAATVGIAMGARGTAISAEAADVVLLVDDVTKVADALEIGQRTISVAKQSIFIGLGASFVLMIIASVGLIPPAIGALLQEILDVSVILNALRAR
jgi:cation transport ATPase